MLDIFGLIIIIRDNFFTLKNAECKRYSSNLIEKYVLPTAEYFIKHSA